MGESLTGIIVISCNHFPFTKFCVESILRNTDKGLYRLCLVDNGSTDQTKVWARDLKNKGLLDNFIDNSKNLGACKAANQGTIWCLENNYDVLICANDHIVTPNWLEPIIGAPFDHVNPFVFYSVRFFRNLGKIGSMIDRYKVLRVKYLQNDNEDNMNIVLKELYGSYGGIDGYAKIFREQFITDPYRSVNMTQWPGLVYYKNALVNKVGLRDEEFLKFTLAGYADIDYQYRISLSGAAIGIAKTSYVHHWGSITTRKNGLVDKKDRYKNSDFDVRKRDERAAIEYLNKKYGKSLKDLGQQF